MNIIWSAHQVGIIIFLFVILIITLTNIKILGNLGRYPMPSRFPRVSVMVPARNEEDNIRSCVESLLAQYYPDFQVIVLDDNSTDRTWKILSELAEENDKLKIFKGEPLPAGWLGKNWACHQLSQKADGDIFLFTDADTQHHPDLIRDGVAAMRAKNADLLTAFPCEKVVTWGERLMVPLFPWFIIGFLPLVIAYKTNSPTLSAAIGQFMMFKRKAYERIEGHKALKNNVVDDVQLARNIKEAGLRWRMVNGKDRIGCRMYHSFQEAYNGFTKNLFAGFGYKIIKFIFVWLWIGFMFLQPLILIILKLLGIDFPMYTMDLAGVAVFLAFMIWLASNWCFRFPLYLALLYPVNMVLILSIAFGSLTFALTGQANWKGRTFARHEIKWW
ncbi:glycosyltransferase [Candidatus Poribacteria bacterium]|nr:glycosyltransferase [Candidatus Poribacteria bacterium]